MGDWLLQAVNSFDPNDKIGPAGYGPQNFVSPAVPLPYKIDFENASTASAPAQRVDITDQLDPDFDWTTFQWTGFGFGNTVIKVPANAQHYSTTLPMTYDGVTSASSSPSTSTRSPAPSGPPSSRSTRPP